MTYKFKNTQLRSKRANNVTPEEHKRVCQFAAKCMRELSKPIYELPILNKSLTVNTKYKNQSCNGGYGQITIDLARIRKGHTHFNEYKSIASHPVIGAMINVDSWLIIEAIIAHEVAHHVQREYAIHMRPSWRNAMQKPHGKGWQMIYKYLRKSLINDRIANLSEGK